MSWSGVKLIFEEVFDLSVGSNLTLIIEVIDFLDHKLFSLKVFSTL